MTPSLPPRQPQRQLVAWSCFMTSGPWMMPSLTLIPMWTLSLRMLQVIHWIAAFLLHSGTNVGMAGWSQHHLGLELDRNKEKKVGIKTPTHSEVGWNASVNMTFLGGSCFTWPLCITCYMSVIPLPVSSHGDKWWVMVISMGYLLEMSNKSMSYY